MTDIPTPAWLEAARADDWLHAAKLAATDPGAPPGFVLHAAIIALTDALTTDALQDAAPR